MNDFIDLVGGDPSFDELPRMFEGAGGQLSGGAHLGNFVFGQGLHILVVTDVNEGCKEAARIRCLTALTGLRLRDHLHLDLTVGPLRGRAIGGLIASESAEDLRRVAFGLLDFVVEIKAPSRR